MLDSGKRAASDARCGLEWELFSPIEALDFHEVCNQTSMAITTRFPDLKA